MNDNANLWKKLSEPFEDKELELLAKYTGKKDSDNKVPKTAYKSCSECGGYHPFPCIHLTYVGHAGITDRLNSIGPENWSWEPMALDSLGQPLMTNGGMWIWMTVLGKKLPAYGDAGGKAVDGKTAGNAIKEVIGDAIRNGAMRFGVGTYLWSKSEKAKDMLEDDEPPAASKPSFKPDKLGALRKATSEYLKANPDTDGKEVQAFIESHVGCPISQMDDGQLQEAIGLLREPAILDHDIEF